MREWRNEELKDSKVELHFDKIIVDKLQVMSRQEIISLLKEVRGHVGSFTDDNDIDRDFLIQLISSDDVPRGDLVRMRRFLNLPEDNLFEEVYSQEEVNNPSSK